MPGMAMFAARFARTLGPLCFAARPGQEIPVPPTSFLTGSPVMPKMTLVFELRRLAFQEEKHPFFSGGKKRLEFDDITFKRVRLEDLGSLETVLGASRQSRFESHLDFKELASNIAYYTTRLLFTKARCG